MEKDQLMKASKRHELLVIGGSAGSLSMVLKLFPFINDTLDIPILVIFHRKQTEDRILQELLAGRTSFKVKEVEDKDEIKRRTIYLAPSDYHVLIEEDRTLSLDASEKVNFSRPSIDVSFESAAQVYGSSLACMLLSGANADGVRGLQSVYKSGGTIIVQDPRTAEVPFMPQSAVENVSVDLLLNDNNFRHLIDLLQSDKIV